MASQKRPGLHHHQGMSAVQPGSEPAGLRNLGLSRSKSVRKTPRIDQVLWLNEWLIAGLDASKRVSMQKEDILNKFFVITLFLIVFIELNQVYRIVYVTLCHPVQT